MRNKNNILFYFTLFIILVLNLLFKITILYIFSVSYISIIISTDFIIKYSDIIDLNFNNKKAKIQTILINYFILSSDSVADAEDKKIIVKNSEIIFNSNQLMRMFLSVVKKPELFDEVFSSNSKTISAFINKHYTYVQQSTKYHDKNISNNFTNFTSKNEIKVFEFEGGKKNY